MIKKIMKIIVNIFWLTWFYNSDNIKDKRYRVFQREKKSIYYKVMQYIFFGVIKLSRLLVKFIISFIMIVLSWFLFIVTLTNITPMMVMVWTAINKMKRTRAEDMDEAHWIQRHQAKRHYSIEQLKDIMKLKKEEKDSENRVKTKLLNNYTLWLWDYLFSIKFDKLADEYTIGGIDKDGKKITYNLIAKEEDKLRRESLDQNTKELTNSIILSLWKDRLPITSLVWENKTSIWDFFSSFVEDFVTLWLEELVRIQDEDKWDKHYLTKADLEDTIKELTLKSYLK